MKKTIFFLTIIIFITGSLFGAIVPSEIRPMVTTQTLTYCLTNDIGNTNAGINYLKITKPAEFDWQGTIVNSIQVRDHYDNNITERTLRNIAFSATWGFTNDQVMIKSNGNDFTLYLGSQITNMSSSSYENIYVDMFMIITNEFTSVSFEAYVDAVQFGMFTNAPSKQNKYSTCGPVKVGGSSIVTRKLDPAYGYATMTPNQIIQGSSSYSFTYYLSSGNIYSEDIKQAAIYVPSEFTIESGSVNSFIINNDSANISITANLNLTNTNTGAKGTNIILLDYNADGKTIPAGGTYDSITFNITGSAPKGTYVWNSWVDGATLDENSKMTITNTTYPNQELMVTGADPSTEGGLISSADPKVLFNVVTKSTLQYKLRNAAPSSEIDNKIYTLVIMLPGKTLTNVSFISNIKHLNSTYVKEGSIANYGGITNITSLTLYYGYQNKYIAPGGTDYDIVYLETIHRFAGSGGTNDSLTAVVDNSNSAGFKDINFPLVENIQITDPQPVGAAYFTVDDGVVYTSDITNTGKYRIYNSAPSGNIYYSRVVFPTNFYSKITNITSTRVSASHITKTKTTIYIDYSTSIMTPGDYDELSFEMVDKYNDIPTPATTVITSYVANDGGVTNKCSDKAPDLGFTMTNWFVPQEMRVSSYVSNNYILTAVTTGTVYYHIKNEGDSGNYATNIKIQLSGSGSSITKVTSIIGGNKWDYHTSSLIVSSNTYTLDGGQEDILTIVLSDTITEDSYVDLIPTATVNTNINESTTLPSLKTNRIFYQAPPAIGYVKVLPNIIFHQSSVSTNVLRFYLLNGGDGSNDIDKAVIMVPDFLQGNLSAISSKYGATKITNTLSQIIINYEASGNSLNTGVTDLITLLLTNDFSVRTNMELSVKLYNANTNGPFYANEFPGASKEIYISSGADAYITPYIIYTKDKTNSFTYKLKNSPKGKNIIRVSISYDSSIFTILTNTLSTTWPFASTKISNSQIIVSYGVNDLDYGAEDNISFKAVSTITTNYLDIPWTATVKYITNSGEYATTSTNGYQKTSILVINWGAISGNVRPSDPQITIKVVSTNGDYAQYATDVLTAGGQIISTADKTNGNYFIDYIPVGNYDIEFSGSEVRSGIYLTNIIIQNDTTTVLPNVILKNPFLRPEITTNQYRYSYYTNLLGTEVNVPANTLPFTLGLDIYPAVISSEEIAALTNSLIGEASGSTASITTFDFDLEDIDWQDIPRAVFTNQISLSLSYSEDEISALGYTESSLAIYEWDDLLNNWIKVGGEVDTEKNIITASVMYLTRKYIILGSATPTDTSIYNLQAQPNPFTPSSSSSSVNRIYVNFEYDSSIVNDSSFFSVNKDANVKVNIFDVAGRLKRSYTLTAEDGNGQFAWDGKDDDGFVVESGIYIYQILIGKHEKTGTIILIK